MTLSGLGISKGDKSGVVLRRGLQYSYRKIPCFVVVNKEAWIWDSSHPTCNLLVRDTHDRKHLKRRENGLNIGVYIMGASYSCPWKN